MEIQNKHALNKHALISGQLIKRNEKWYVISKKGKITPLLIKE